MGKLKNKTKQTKQTASLLHNQLREGLLFCGRIGMLPFPELTGTVAETRQIVFAVTISQETEPFIPGPLAGSPNTATCNYPGPEK